MLRPITRPPTTIRRQDGPGKEVIPEGDRGPCDRKQQGGDREEEVIRDRRAGIEPQHGDEMHRPDADAHGDCGERDPALLGPRTVTSRPAEQVKCRPGSEDGDGCGQQGIDERVVVVHADSGQGCHRLAHALVLRHRVLIGENESHPVRHHRSNSLVPAVFATNIGACQGVVPTMKPVAVSRIASLSGTPGLG